ncbi:MAG: Lrp/AsnC ligand binding domain-containing protein [Sphingomonadaceae bacterium]|nr:Lrp/AsnC ligand binding domain-containing protein [Sphingomonadaceae bacterium]
MRQQIKIICERVAAVFRVALGGAGSSRTGYAELARRSHPRAAATLFAKVIVRPRTEGQCAQFEAAVRQVPAILSAHRLSGSGDYLLELTQEYPIERDRMKE